MGAQRVKANFNEIEQKATVYDKEKETTLSSSLASETKAKNGNGDKPPLPISSKLMMRDVEVQRKQAEVAFVTNPLFFVLIVL